MDSEFLRNQMTAMNNVMLAGIQCGQEMAPRRRIDMADYSQIPPHMMERMKAYAVNHEPVGNFLEAVITNDFAAACFRADDVNVHILPVYAHWFHWESPALCHGSFDAYLNWITPKSEEA